MPAQSGFRTAIPPLAYFIVAWIAGLVWPATFPVNELLVAGLVLTGIWVITHWPARRRPFFRTVFFLTGMLTALVWGRIYRQLRQPVFPRVATYEAPHVWGFQAGEVLKSTAAGKRYFVYVYRRDSLPVDEKALLYVADSLIPGQYYTAVSAAGEMVALPRPYYPYAFDYGNYLRHKGVAYRLFVKDPSRIREFNRINRWRHFPYRWRERIKKIFRKYLSADSFRVASALLLGDRRELTYDLREAFVDAGVVHILAISGMHIGILLFFLRALFAPFRFRYKWLYHTLVLGILWFYAWLTGFSPSVLRAVIMFGFFQLAWEGQRDVHGLYILLLSAFVILMIQPLMILDVGFQLSFAAVASIILFFPLLKRLYYPSVKVWRYVVDLTYVSVAAQFGVIPLILYYFHRFSFGFLLSNLLVIPMLTIALGLGFTAIGLILFHLPAGWILALLDKVLEGMLIIIRHVSAWQIGVFKNVWFDGYMMAAWMAALVAIYVWWKKGMRQMPLWAWISMVLAIWLASIPFYKRHYMRSLVLTTYKGKPLLLHREGRRLSVYADTAVPPAIALHYRQQTGTDTAEYHPFPLFFRYDTLRFRLFRDDAVIPSDTFHSDILMLYHSPKIHLDMLLNHAHPQKVIFAGSNSYFIRNHWQQTLNRRRIPFHDLQTAGYLEW